MSISYKIYANNGQGGLVDYDSPVATTSSLTWTVGPLAFPSDNRFGVRAFDDVSGIEEANTDATARIVLDLSGNDVTNQPNAVVGLAATATSGGTCWVTWGYDATNEGEPPAEFAVTLTAGTTPSLGPPTATVPYQAGISGYDCTLSGLSSDTRYAITVQGIGASNDLPGPSVTVSLEYRVAALGNVDSLTALATP
jgi:hypothetical protein